MSDLLGVFQEVVLCEEKEKTLRIFSCVQMTVNTCRHFREKSMIYFFDYERLPGVPFLFDIEKYAGCRNLKLARIKTSYILCKFISDIFMMVLTNVVIGFSILCLNFEKFAQMFRFYYFCKIHR